MLWNGKACGADQITAEMSMGDFGQTSNELKNTFDHTMYWYIEKGKCAQEMDKGIDLQNSQEKQLAGMQ